MKKVLLNLIFFSISYTISAQHMVTMTIDYDISFEGKVDYYTFRGLLPFNYYNKQEILDIRFTPEDPIILKNDTIWYFEYRLDKTPKSKKFHIQVEYDVALYDYDLNTAMELNHKILDSTAFSFLPGEDGKRPPKNIRTALAEFEEEDNLEMVKKIHQFVIDTLEYKRKFSGQWLTPSQTLKRKGGVCAHYAELFVTLCREKGIPARSVDGLVARTGDNVYHGWAEVYLEQYGWVPFDPTHAEGSSLTSFYNLKNNRIYYYYGGMNKAFGDRLWKHWWKSSDYSNYAMIHVESNYTSSFDSRDMLLEGARLYNRHHYDSALVIFDKLIQFNKENPRYTTFKAMILARQGKFEEAEAWFGYTFKSMKVDYQKAHSNYSYGNFLALKGEKELSILYLRKALELGFEDVEHIKADEDLISLYDHPDFQALIAEYETKLQEESLE
ncbi:MAG: transglutaminase domain-containing protein [Bacteroidota bacterium]